jgi:hypothetical protein
MGWTAVDLSDAKKPVAPSLGPYREAATAETGAAVERRWRWTTTGNTAFLILFTLVWNGILVLMMVITLRGHQAVTVENHTHASWTEAAAHDPWVLLFLSFPLVGVGMAYLLAAVWFNRTQVALRSGWVVITRGPLPWRRRLVTVAAATLREVYLDEYVSHEENERPTTAYRVNARLTDGSEMMIDRGMKYYEDAWSLVKWIETQLKIGSEKAPALAAPAR